MDYNQLKETLGSRTSKKLDHNTYAIRYKDGMIRIDLHGHQILNFDQLMVTVDHCGYPTNTTKDRINKFLPGNWSICKHKNEWWWWHSVTHKRVTIFTPGDTMHFKDGEWILKTQATESDIKDRADLMKRVKAYAKLYGAAIPMDYPNLGDCFACQTGSDGPDHIAMHVREKYIMVSMLLRAMKESPTSKVMEWCLIKPALDDQESIKLVIKNNGSLEQFLEKQQSLLKTMPTIRDQVSKAMEKWICRKLGLVA